MNPSCNIHDLCALVLYNLKWKTSRRPVVDKIIITIHLNVNSRF